MTMNKYYEPRTDCNPEEVIPTNREFPRVIEINKIENGYLVNVGCKTFCFISIEATTKAIEMYFTNPKQAEETYMGGTK